MSILPGSLTNHTSYKRHGPSVSQKHLFFFFVLRTEFPVLTSQLLNPVFWSCFYPAPVLTFHRWEGHVWSPLNSAIIYNTPQLLAFQLSKSRGDVLGLTTTFPMTLLCYASEVKNSWIFCAPISLLSTNFLCDAWLSLLLCSWIHA